MFYMYIIQNEKQENTTSEAVKILIVGSKNITTELLFYKPGIPWKLVYKEEYRTRTEALKREREVKKKKSRKYIEFLINSSDN